MRLEDYEVERELGRGAMGVVYQARHRTTGARHALKRVELVDAEAALRFEREAAALGRVGGPGLVPVHGVQVEGRRAWLAMALLPGGTLRQRLRRGQPWAAAEALALTLELARAVARCHAAGLVHRDLKPENVLFSEDGRPHIADLGLVRDLHAGPLTATGTVLGTPAYMAPEQLLGLPAGPPADVFALGAILHELLAGAPAFAHLSPVARALHPGVPAAPRGTPSRVAGLLAAALDPAPERRPADGAALARSIEAVLAAPGSARGGRLASRALAAGATAALLAALAAGWPDGPPAATDAPAGAPAATGSGAAVARRPRAEEVTRALLDGAPLSTEALAALEEDAELAAAALAPLLGGSAAPEVALRAVARLDGEAPQLLRARGVALALDGWATARASQLAAVVSACATPADLFDQVLIAARAHELAARGSPAREPPACVEDAEGLLRRLEEPHRIAPARVEYLRACARVGGVPEGHGKKDWASLRAAVQAAPDPDWTLAVLRGLGPLLEEGPATDESRTTAAELRALLERDELPRRARGLCLQIVAAIELRDGWERPGELRAAERRARDALESGCPRPDLAWRVLVWAALRREDPRAAEESADGYLAAAETARAAGEAPAGPTLTSPVKKRSVKEAARRLSATAYVLAGALDTLEGVARREPDVVVEALLEACRAAKGRAHRLRDALDRLAAVEREQREGTLTSLRTLAQALSQVGRGDEGERLRAALDP